MKCIVIKVILLKKYQVGSISKFAKIKRIAMLCRIIVELMVVLKNYKEFKFEDDLIATNFHLNLVSYKNPVRT